jgi:hypothetical protein
MQILGSHREEIICPSCNKPQAGTVQYTAIWNIYIHECTLCHYLIMESEWNKKPKEDAKV